MSFIGFWSTLPALTSPVSSNKSSKLQPRKSNNRESRWRSAHESLKIKKWKWIVVTNPVHESLSTTVWRWIMVRTQFRGVGFGENPVHGKLEKFSVGELQWVPEVGDREWERERGGLTVCFPSYPQLSLCIPFSFFSFLFGILFIAFSLLCEENFGSFFYSFYFLICKTSNHE